ncbi:MAG: hypothetical protein ACLR23_00115 [Clostridia bacterium]
MKLSAGILSVKFAMGLFEHPYHEPDSAEKFMLTPQSRELARDIARHCCVLLKNEDHILPLSPSKKYFLTGPLSDNEEDMPGAWATYDPETNVITVKKAMEEAGYDFVHYDGCPLPENTVSRIQMTVAFYRLLSWQRTVTRSSTCAVRGRPGPVKIEGG